MTQVRYAYAITGALLLSGAAAAMTLDAPLAGQVAQNEPGTIAAAAPKAGAPMSFADMVARLQPAVVNISTTQRVTVQQPTNPFSGTPFGDLFGQFNGGDQGGSGQPITREAQSLGSGFIISPDGYVVTNNHVIAAGAKGATVESIKVTLPDRKEYTAKLIGRDPASDLALLKIEASGLPFVKFGDSARARVGDWVVAIGNPFGLGSTVTAGIVSALHRVTGQGGAYDRFIQTDASINQGNSGGPMFDLSGNVIGINSQILSPTGGNVGIWLRHPGRGSQADHRHADEGHRRQARLSRRRHPAAHRRHGGRAGAAGQPGRDPRPDRAGRRRRQGRAEAGRRRRPRRRQGRDAGPDAELSRGQYPARHGACRSR